MENYVKWLTGSGLASETEIAGLSNKKITQIEGEYSIKLPNEYKDFLRQCGRRAGMFARDIDIFYPNFLRLRDEFDEVAEDFGIKYKPEANAFFFSAYQGGSFHYFLCESADTKIYVLNDGDTLPAVANESFTAFVLCAISSYQDALFGKSNKDWMQY